ncbi:MAG: hypothetical protein HN759_02535 [Akkermansiaceae bacterium]|jgi:hypothetical protein|nr:hypothetical protein [Akkermansiaceae bacterium]
MSDEEEPDWESFETYKGPEEEPRTPRWLGRVFHYFMILLCLSIAFSIGGILFYILSFSRRNASHETMDFAQQKFIAGGIVGVILILYWRFRSQP